VEKGVDLVTQRRQPQCDSDHDHGKSAARSPPVAVINPAITQVVTTMGIRQHAGLIIRRSQVQTIDLREAAPALSLTHRSRTGGQGQDLRVLTRPAMDRDLRIQIMTHAPDTPH
jgi:hypothetical protein